MCAGHAGMTTSTVSAATTIVARVRASSPRPTVEKPGVEAPHAAAPELTPARAIPLPPSTHGRCQAALLPRTARRPSCTAAIARATTKTIRKLTPETPNHANSGDSGLADCEKATRPHENPPYGQTLATASRRVQSPATTTGTNSRRLHTVGNARGTQR